MGWEVEVTDEFQTWWDSLSEDEQVDVAASVQTLEERALLQRDRDIQASKNEGASAENPLEFSMHSIHGELRSCS